METIHITILEIAKQTGKNSEDVPAGAMGEKAMVISSFGSHVNGTKWFDHLSVQQVRTAGIHV